MTDTPAQDTGHTAPPPQSTEPAAPPADWRASLPEDLRDHGTIQKYQTAEDAFRALVSAQSLISGTRPTIPKDGDPPEAWDNLFKALGPPDAPDGYEWDGPGEDYPAGLYSPDLDKNWKEAAHKLGLSKKQASEARQWLLELQKADYDKNYQAFSAQRNAAMESLKTEWGPNYDRNVELSRRLIMTYAEPETIKALEEGMGNDPRLVRLAYKIARDISEDRLVRPESRESGTSVDDEIAKVMRSEAYQKASHPDHDQVVQKVAQLFDLKYK